MNKIGYQPLPVLLRAEPSDARPASNSATFLRVVAILGTAFALCGVVAIFLIGFRELPSRPLDAKKTVEAPVFPTTTLSPAAVPSLDKGVGVPLPDRNQVLRGTIAEDHSILDRSPAPPAGNPNSTPAQVSEPQASVSDGNSLKIERSENVETKPNKFLSEAIRKNLERHRRKAERKRSQLEAMYGKHAISRDAYEEGEQKYKSQIERYRTEMNAHMGSNNQESEGQN